MRNYDKHGIEVPPPSRKPPPPPPPPPSRKICTPCWQNVDSTEYKKCLICRLFRLK